jgi:quercetin dioxygenase-like cupin family protein
MKLIAHASQEPAVATPDGAERRVLSYGDNIMLVQVSFPAGVASWDHSHPHAQVSYVVSGEIDFVREGFPPVRLVAGGSCYVPPDVRHHIETHAPSVLLDCFSPMRQDFVEGR